MEVALRAAAARVRASSPPFPPASWDSVRLRDASGHPRGASPMGAAADRERTKRVRPWASVEGQPLAALPSSSDPNLGRSLNPARVSSLGVRVQVGLGSVPGSCERARKARAAAEAPPETRLQSCRVQSSRAQHFPGWQLATAPPPSPALVRVQPATGQVPSPRSRPLRSPFLPF